MGILFGWKAFVAAILGGRGSILGATLAGFLLGFTEIFVAMVFPSTLRDLIAYSIILLTCMGGAQRLPIRRSQAHLDRGHAHLEPECDQWLYGRVLLFPPRVHGVGRIRRLGVHRRPVRRRSILRSRFHQTSVRQPDGPGEPSIGHLRPERPQGDRGRSRPGIFDLPTVERAAGSDGRDHERRRAADAGRRARVHEREENHAPGRAVHGAGPLVDEERVRLAEGNQPGGNHHSGRGAECPDGAPIRRSGVRTGEWPARSGRRVRRTSRRPPGQKSLSGGAFHSSGSRQR